jgi:hypothetical protein
MPLVITKTPLDFLNQLAKTRVHIDVTNEDGNRIDGIDKIFKEGQEIAQAEWIDEKTKLFKEQYPVETTSKAELMAQIAGLQKPVRRM